MLRTIVAAAVLSLSACAASPPAGPYARLARLPVAACGDMAALRANLTGAPDPSAESDATLRRLGVRCIAGSPPSPLARAPY